MEITIWIYQALFPQNRINISVSRDWRKECARRYFRFSMEIFTLSGITVFPQSRSKGIVSHDWGGPLLAWSDRYKVPNISRSSLFVICIRFHIEIFEMVSVQVRFSQGSGFSREHVFSRIFIAMNLTLSNFMDQDLPHNMLSAYFQSDPTQITPRRSHLPWKWGSGEKLLRSSSTQHEQIVLRKILLLRKIHGYSALRRKFNMKTRLKGKVNVVRKYSRLL
jgi:hypothetical protein